MRLPRRFLTERRLFLPYVDGSSTIYYPLYVVVLWREEEKVMRIIFVCCTCWRRNLKRGYTTRKFTPEVCGLKVWNFIWNWPPRSKTKTKMVVKSLFKIRPCLQKKKMSALVKSIHHVTGFPDFRLFRFNICTTKNPSSKRGLLYSSIMQVRRRNY